MNLGSLLRRQRKKIGLTLKEVAEKASLSEGFMSQVENNVKTPSLPKLMKICEAIQSDMGALFQELKNQEQVFLIRRDEWGEVDLPHTGFATRRFCPPDQRTVIDSAMLFIEPGKSIPVRKDIKNGQEVLCVLKGALELVHGDQTITLEENDAVHIWTDPQSQSITNTGDRPAVVLWVGVL